ncbi:hypothetical protein Hypma_010785 [Hypsizygus marmoreus]|uniref:Uncharacterized protein n=1 Tax=Hypsizygus marmoreus TaxID=39966 RepID=A0A369JL38_HYPMA|nr:hypothetical protein Hypma_010785 [Hypsizygus marmoreus]
MIRSIHYTESSNIKSRDCATGISLKYCACFKVSVDYQELISIFLQGGQHPFRGYDHKYITARCTTGWAGKEWPVKLSRHI